MNPKRFYSRAAAHLDTAEVCLLSGDLAKANQELNAAWLVLEHQKAAKHNNSVGLYSRLSKLTLEYARLVKQHACKETQP